MTSIYERTGCNDAGQSSDSGTGVATGSSAMPVSAGSLRHADARPTASQITPAGCTDATSRTTAIEQCVQHELSRYFDMLDGEEPAHLYRMVMKQAENAVIRKVMTECRGNQTRASLWLGISRGNLRTKLANMES